MTIATERNNAVTDKEWENVAHHVEIEEKKYTFPEVQMNLIRELLVIIFDTSDQ